MVSMVMAGALMFISSCGHKPDPAPSAADVFIKSVSQTWVLGTVTEGGKDVTGAFAGFTLTLNNNGTYTSTANPLHGVFLATGVYSPKLNATTISGLFDLTLDNATTITVTALTSTQLKFEFQYTTSSMRIAGVSGKYQFVMQPK